MGDVFTKEKRRQIMQAVRRTGTEPEARACKGLRAAGFRFRRNVAALPGKPDIVLSELKTVVLVHGCFWHGHKACAKGRKRTRIRRHYWQEKIDRNRRRDRRVARDLRTMGYAVFTVWECELRKSGIPKRILTALRKRSPH